MARVALVPLVSDARGPSVVAHLIQARLRHSSGLVFNDLMRMHTEVFRFN